MSLVNSYKRSQNESGFTIVELLIVIVVIAILAAITVVSYNGITARANSSSAKQSAQQLVKKVEAYNAEEAAYPTLALLTATTNASKSYGGVASTAFTTAALAAKPDPATKVAFNRCGTGAANTQPTQLSEITTITGAKLDYWNFNTTAAESVYAGQGTGLVGTKNIACYFEAGS